MGNTRRLLVGADTRFSTSPPQRNCHPGASPAAWMRDEPADVAALAVHLMTNTAITGATYDIDGGQQFVAS
jgi:hypothetical protein